MNILRGTHVMILAVTVIFITIGHLLVLSECPPIEIGEKAKWISRDLV